MTLKDLQNEIIKEIINQENIIKDLYNLKTITYQDMIWSLEDKESIRKEASLIIFNKYKNNKDFINLIK